MRPSLADGGIGAEPEISISELRCFSMTMSRAIRVAAAATMLFSVFAIAQDQEKKIRRSDLPPAAERAVAGQRKGATIRGFLQEKGNGQNYYEAELMVLNGHTKDLLVDANGSVVEVEEQVSTESLPPAVRRGLQDKAGKGKLVKVETLTKKDKLVAYEAKVLNNGKKSEVQVGGRESFRSRGIKTNAVLGTITAQPMPTASFSTKQATTES
jgi:hypothetical protein